MKAPKNFYNTVDQTKLGIDDLFARTAENEADIIALENAISDIEAKEALKSVKYFRVVMDRTSGDSFHVNGFRLHSSSMNEDFTFPGGSTVSASVTIPNIQLLIQNETREVGVWHVDNLYPFNIDFYVPTGVDLTVYNEVQFLGGFYENTFPQSAKLLISDDGTTYKEVKSNDSITFPGANNRVDFFGFDADPVIEDIYDRIEDLETVVGDSTDGLVKDVNDLQDASEQYHDDIADLKTADITLGLRIDDVKDDLDPHTFFDIEATVNITSSSATSGIVGTLDVTGYDNWGQAATALVNSGKIGRIIADGPNSTKWVFYENRRIVDAVFFSHITDHSTTLRFYYVGTPISATYTDSNIRLITVQGVTT